MSLFSKTTEYAIRAVFYVASRSTNGDRPGIREIAENINSPEHFLAKILQRLTKTGIVSSIKGPNGGFFIEPEGLKRPIGDIITSLEGDEMFTGCGLGLSYCSESNPCPLHNEFKKVRSQLTHMLFNTSIGEFNVELLSGKVTLNK